jgi:hypothetical protein
MKTIHRKALCQITAVWATAAFAAGAWASGISEEGYILDAADWRSEVASVPSPDWPVDGWYRLAPGRKAIAVRAMMPSQADPGDPEGAVYVRVPGLRLVEGERARVRFAAGELKPRVGTEYQFALGPTPFSFVVQSGRDGTRYEITYGGEMHAYMLGLPAAATKVKAIADFDGDAQPDFLVEVGEDTFLLLSTQARPGGNPPTAQLWAMGS